MLLIMMILLLASGPVGSQPVERPRVKIGDVSHVGFAFGESGATFRCPSSNNLGVYIAPDDIMEVMCGMGESVGVVILSKDGYDRIYRPSCRGSWGRDYFEVTRSAWYSAENEYRMWLRDTTKAREADARRVAERQAKIDALRRQGAMARP